MVRLALATLRFRRGGFVGALVAVVLAVALVVSAAAIVGSTLRAGTPVDRLAAAPVVVAGRQSLHLSGGQNDAELRERVRVDARLARRLRRVPGARRVVADRTVAAVVAAPDGRRLTGGADSTPVHGWSSAVLEPLALVAGRSPRATSDAVLDRDLASAWSLRPGSRLRLSTPFGALVVIVAGIAAPAPTHGPSADPAVYLRDDVAAELSGSPGRADLLAVLPVPGTDPASLALRVRAAVAPLGLDVLTGPRRGDAESLTGRLARSDLLSGLSVLGSLAAFVSVFVVASAFALSIQQRHRELALLRTIGATPVQVRRLVAAEALAVSLLGAALAVPLGFAIAYEERALFVHAGMLAPGFQLAVGWIPAALGTAVAVVATQVAAFASGRRASRIRPMDALREASVEQRPLTRLRALAGVAALLLGIVVFASTSHDVSGGGGDDAPASGVVWMLAATLLGPALALPFVVAAGPLLERLANGPGLLARANLRRLTSVATPLMLTVSLACALLVSRAVVRDATRGQVARSVVADRVLVPAGDGLAPGTAAAVRRLPGVAAAVGTLPTQVLVATGGGSATELPAQAVDASGLARVVDLGVVSGSLATLRAGGVAVAERRARALGWHVGDRVGLWLGDGTRVRLRVAALFRRPAGFAEIVLSRSVVDRHVTSAFDRAVFARVRDGRGLAAYATAHPATRLLTRDGYVRRVDADLRRQAVAVYLLLGVVVLFSGIAAVNALAAAISDRARELELLRLVGASRKQLGRMVRLEVALTVVFATVLGVATAGPGVAVFSYGKTGSFVPHPPVWIWLGLPSAAIALGMAASVLPTRRALRVGRGSVTVGME
jgi:putative ABC transport system permease protein